MLKVLRDTWLMFQREAGLMIRDPVSLAFAMTQPIAYLVIFAPFLKAAMGNATSGSVSYADAYRAYVPGLFAAMGVFGGLFAGYSLLGLLRAGIIDRFRVTRISRAGLLLGRALKDVAGILIQAVIITVAALPFGLRVPVGNLLLAYLTLALMAMLGTAISYTIALLVKDMDPFSSVVNTVIQPIALLAGCLIPLSLAPAWIRGVSKVDPFAWGTQGIRALFNDRPGDPAVWLGIGVVLVLTTLTVMWSARLFARAVR